MDNESARHRSRTSLRRSRTAEVVVTVSVIALVAVSAFVEPALLMTALIVAAATVIAVVIIALLLTKGGRRARIG